MLALNARRCRAVTVAAGLAAGLVLGAPAAPGWAVEDNLCESVTSGTPATEAQGSSLPLEELDVRAARTLVERYAPRDQRPVRVAVLDSGVYGDVGGGGPIPIAERTSYTGHPELGYYHGTAVAGLIAGRERPDGKPVGIAPDAEIVDVRVYDDAEPSDDADPVDAPTLADGLEWVATHADDLNIRVANVSLAVRDVGGVEEAVQDVRDAGVIVVASSGNRPQEGDEFDADFADAGDAAGIHGEDAGPLLFPAGYDGVVTVNSTDAGDEGSSLVDQVLKNSRTVVAVPTYGAISYGLNGATCTVGPIATSWAAAEVSGVLALLWQRYPEDTAKQILARLVYTASGTTADPTPLTGAGVVQPVEALTRPLDPSRRGAVEGATTRDRGAEVRATAPEPEPDVLASMRDDAVWWGLIGGGTLVVALLLRPVLARRRP